MADNEHQDNFAKEFRDELGRIYKQLHLVGLQLERIKATSSNEAESMNRLAGTVNEQLRKITETLYGNGREGVVTTLSKQEDTVGLLRERVNWILGLLGTFLVALVVRYLVT